MRYLKITFSIFIFSFLISSYAAYAATDFASVVGVELPVFGGETQATYAFKSVDNAQYYKSHGTVDNLTSAYVNVKVKTICTSQTGEYGCVHNATSGFLTLGANQSSSWGNNVYNGLTGWYDLYARRENWAVSTATHSGSWYLNGNLF